MFSENWLEEHGNASFQDYWFATELDSSVSGGQEGDAHRDYQQDQEFGWKNAMAPIRAPRRQLKFHKGGCGEEDWESKSSLAPGHYSWFKALDKALV